MCQSQCWVLNGLLQRLEKAEVVHSFHDLHLFWPWPQCASTLFEDLPGRNLCMKWGSRNVSAKPQNGWNIANQTLNSWVHSLSWSLHTWPLKDLTEQNWSLVPTLGRRYPHNEDQMSADISPISTEPEATLAFQRNWPPDSEPKNWSCGNPALQEGLPAFARSFAALKMYNAQP